MEGGKQVKVRMSFFVFLMSLLTVNLLAQKNLIIINADQREHHISRHIYGHFAEHLGYCIYGGFWVGEDSAIPNTRGIRNDVVQALRDIKIPNLRWQGGCFADTYHCKDGVGLRNLQPEIVNIHWGNVTEDKSFGTHEFMNLCQQLGCEPYICGNLGSGTVQEMAEWVEYLTSPAQSPMTRLRKENGRQEPWKVKYWGLGNEKWGCNGRMTAEYYVDKSANYNVFCRNYPGNELYKIACGGYADRNDYHWTEVLMRDSWKRIRFDAHTIHYYSNGTLRPRKTAADFEEAGWFDIIRVNFKMDDIIKQNIAIMDRYDPENKVDLIVDEWGNWFEVEPATDPRFLYQQNTLRDALGAAIQLNIFNNYCERVKMTNIAQTVNVLQAMILTKEEKIIKTPTY